jgi:hypothetical protein
VPYDEDVHLYRLGYEDPTAFAALTERRHAGALGRLLRLETSTASGVAKESDGQRPSLGRAGPSGSNGLHSPLAPRLARAAAAT